MKTRWQGLQLLRDIGLGYLRLGQPATELSGGEAQRIKLATELQRSQRGRSLYVLDEPTTGLHASDADRLLVQLQRLVDAGNTVVMIEHDMRAVAQADWVIDVGPGAGAAGGSIVVAGSLSRWPESLAAEPLRSLHGSWRGPSSLVRQMLPASRGIDRRHTVVTVAARVASSFLSQSKIGIVGRYFGEYQGPFSRR